MLFHRNISHRDRMQIPFPVSGWWPPERVKCTGSGRGDAQIAASAQVAHHGMHGAGRPNDGIHRTGRIHGTAMQFGSSITASMRAGSASCASPSTGCGSTFSKAAILTSPLRHRRAAVYFHPVRRLLPHRATPVPALPTLALRQLINFSTTGSSCTAKRREAYPSKPKISPNRLMAITAIQTALITTSPNH